MTQQPGWMHDFAAYVQKLTESRPFDTPRVTELRKVLRMREDALQDAREHLRNERERHEEWLDEVRDVFRRNIDKQNDAHRLVVAKRDATIAALESSVQGLRHRNEQLNRDLEASRKAAQANHATSKSVGMDKQLAAENVRLKQRNEELRENRDELAELLHKAEAELRKVEAKLRYA